MAVAALRRCAAAAPVPVFIARGGGAGLRPVELAADRRIVVVRSPRHASVLLAAGRFPGSMGVALARVHDQLPAPRATVWWTADVDAERPAALWDATVVAHPEPVDTIVACHRAVMLGGARSSPDVLPNVPPNLFEGRGDHGQGGEGMMGGVPYGRPMAMLADDRDGLSLDQLTFTAGPFLTGFPNGVQANVTLQGGVVQHLALEILDAGAGPALDDLDAGVVDDARRTLRWLAESLRLGGLDALAVRASRSARAGADVATMAATVRRCGLPAAWAGIGEIDGVDARTRLLEVLEPGSRLASRPARALTLGAAASVLVGADWSDALVAIWSYGMDLVATRTAGVRG